MRMWEEDVESELCRCVRAQTYKQVLTCEIYYALINISQKTADYVGQCGFAEVKDAAEAFPHLALRVERSHSFAGKENLAITPRELWHRCHLSISLFTLLLLICSARWGEGC